MFCLISKRMCCRNRFPENRRAKQNSVPEKQRVGIFSLSIPRATNRSGFRKKKPDFENRFCGFSSRYRETC